MAIKAFVSSTFEDLKEHRAHVIAALRKAGVAVDPMEDWTASSAEPKAFSRARLEGCDLCILLVGLRRGHVPQGESLSITQLEVAEARARGIDTLVFLLDEDAPWPRRFDELDRDPAVRAWRAELLETRGVSRFGLDPASVQVAPAVTRWLAEREARPRPALVIQTVDFKCAEVGRRNRLLLFNGHAIPVFAEEMRLWRDGTSYTRNPTFTLDTVVPANSIVEIVSPPFRDRHGSSGEAWSFPPGEWRAGVIQSLDTNWSRPEPGWETETWPNGDPVYVHAAITYRAGADRLVATTWVWQGFTFAEGHFWR